MVTLSGTADKKCGVFYFTGTVSTALDFSGVEQGPVAVRFHKRREVS
jgi:hypothetical protein